MKQHLASILVALAILLSACGQLEGDALSFRTADPHLSVGFRLLPAPPVTIEPQVLPEATATEEPSLVPTPTATPECVNAKANISASGERIYHMPGDANYNTVKIDKDGEAIYCTAAEAEAAGFRRTQR